MAFDQEQNLRDVILKKKARIAHIERALNRPLPAEYRGLPVHVSQSSLIGLEEDRQHLLLAVGELEIELERLVASKRKMQESTRSRAAEEPITGGEPGVWQRLHAEFEAISIEEQKELRNTRQDRGLHAFDDFKNAASSEFGDWMLYEGPNESLRARFEVLATCAGIALGSSQGTKPIDFWFSRLYLDLMENRSKHLRFATKKGEDGIIEFVCAASAIFCARLEKDALEKSGTKMVIEALGTGRAQQSRTLSCKGQDRARAMVAEIKRDNPGISQRDICAKLDARNDRSSNKAPLPQAWRRFNERSWVGMLEKHPKRVKPFLSKVKPAAQTDYS